MIIVRMSNIGSYLWAKMLILRYFSHIRESIQGINNPFWNRKCWELHAYHYSHILNWEIMSVDLKNEMYYVMSQKLGFGICFFLGGRGDFFRRLRCNCRVAKSVLTDRSYIILMMFTHGDSQDIKHWQVWWTKMLILRHILWIRGGNRTHLRVQETGFNLQDIEHPTYHTHVWDAY